MKFRLIVNRKIYKNKIPTDIEWDLNLRFDHKVITQSPDTAIERIKDVIFESDFQFKVGNIVDGYKICNMEFDINSKIMNLICYIDNIEDITRDKYFSDRIKNMSLKYKTFYNYEYLKCINGLNYKMLCSNILDNILKDITYYRESGTMDGYIKSEDLMLDYLTVGHIFHSNNIEDIFYVIRKYNLDNTIGVIRYIVDSDYRNKPLFKYFRKRFGGI